MKEVACQFADSNTWPLIRHQSSASTEQRITCEHIARLDIGKKDYYVTAVFKKLDWLLVRLWLCISITLIPVPKTDCDAAAVLLFWQCGQLRLLPISFRKWLMVALTRSQRWQGWQVQTCPPLPVVFLFWPQLQLYILFYHCWIPCFFQSCCLHCTLQEMNLSVWNLKCQPVRPVLTRNLELFIVRLSIWNRLSETTVALLKLSLKHHKALLQTVVSVPRLRQSQRQLQDQVFC